MDAEPRRPADILADMAQRQVRQRKEMSDAARQISAERSQAAAQESTTVRTETP